MDLEVFMLAPFYPDEQEIAGGHIGGVERDVREISRELAEQGVNVRVVASSDHQGKEKDGKVRVTRVKRSSMLFRTPMFKWKDHIGRNVDIINAQGTYPLLSDRSATVARKLNIPSVLTYHRDGSSESLLGRMATGIYYSTLAGSMKKHTKIVATTRSYAKASRFLKDIPPKQLDVIPNGVDTELFHPDVETEAVLKKHKLKEGYVLFVGRLVHYKGLDYLLKAVKGSGLKLVIAGAGPLEKELRSRHVGKFLGYVGEEELPALYKSASVTVLPSIDPSEAFGMCLIESMACGTPVVGTDLAGVKEVCSLNGVSVKKQDPAALRKGINKVLGKEYHPRKMHAGIKKRFSWERVGRDYLKLYKSLVH